jgi:hypothetical protein
MEQVGGWGEEFKSPEGRGRWAAGIPNSGLRRSLPAQGGLGATSPAKEGKEPRSWLGGESAPVWKAQRQGVWKTMEQAMRSV